MKTLLRLFFIPRLKNVGILVTVGGLLISMGLYTRQLELVGLAFLLTFSFFGAVAFNSHMTANIEWLKNSAFDAKTLFRYYVFEQTLTIVVMGSIMVTGSFGFFYGLATYDFDTSKKAALLDKGTGVMGVLAEDGLANLSYLSVSEKALETVFVLFFIFAVGYGAELVKTYFTKLKYERRYTKEAYFFNGLVVTIVLFVFMKDTSLLSRIINMKILVIPLFVGVVSFALIVAANNTFKMFKQDWKSWQGFIPLSITMIIFAFSIGFSKLNYGLNKNIDEVIAEQRFQWIFSSNIPQSKIDEFYLNTQHLNNLEYLIEKFPGFSQEHFNEMLVNRKSAKGLVVLTRIWKLNELNEKELKAFFKSFDKKVSLIKRDRKRDKVLVSLVNANEEFWNIERVEIKKSASYIKIIKYLKNKKESTSKKRNISSLNSKVMKKKEPSI